MAVKSSARKRKAQAQFQDHGKPSKSARPATAPAAGVPGPASLYAVTSEEELDIAVETLNALSAHPELIKSKQCRRLRAAVYEFRQACTTGVNAAGMNLTARITAALADAKYVECRILLAEMRIRGEMPKVGALCRWVRDLDIISRLSTLPAHSQLVTERPEEEQERLLVVDAILRAIGPVDRNPGAIRHNARSPSIRIQDIWDLRSSTTRHDVYASVLDKTILGLAPDSIQDALSVIEITEGPMRKPPNHHPAVLYTSAPNAISLSPTPPPTEYHEHPVVPGLALATNVLSSDECKAIIAAGESVGFLPDAPIRTDGNDSILAHNFYWVVDTTFHDLLWARISPHVPSVIDGRIARGINRRFRVYRYVPGAEYRCHIDGAWPPSGILPDQRYIYDASPQDQKQSSLFTFLVYLNDEFEGGETTFFLPGAQEGSLNAYPVRPVMGAVAMFPHGETRGALLHEGTGVRSGAKYVIRTDVEYDVEPSTGS